MKVVGESPDCGISVKNTVTQAITKLAINDIVLNEPSRLLILVPSELAKGEYELRLTTQYTGGNTLLKTPRTIICDLPIILE